MEQDKSSSREQLQTIDARKEYAGKEDAEQEDAIQEDAEQEDDKKMEVTVKRVIRIFAMASCQRTTSQ